MIQPPDGPAVYFLLDGAEVVYVGGSCRPAFRWLEHRDKVYDSAVFLPADEGALGEMERHWIAILRPKYNKNGNPDYVPPRRDREHMKVGAHVGIRAGILPAVRQFGKRLGSDNLTVLVNQLLLEALDARGLMKEGIVWRPKLFGEKDN